MTLVPIVARELRAASRRPRTFIIRSSVALLGATIGGFLVLMLDLTGSMGGKGELVFGVVTFYTFLIALLTGIFLASDCLSAERRQGTLGVLFLTPLTSYDVV